jgi:hypothetical protein|eukprot:COSAG06_NODE_3560_length_5184_cov_2.380728_5_plen_81_part_00
MIMTILEKGDTANALRAACPALGGGRAACAFTAGLRPLRGPVRMSGVVHGPETLCGLPRRLLDLRTLVRRPRVDSGIRWR